MRYQSLDQFIFVLIFSVFISAPVMADQAAFPVDEGFLSIAYEDMRIVERPAGFDLVHVAPGAFEKLANYEGIIIDQPEIWIDRQSGYPGAQPDYLKAIADLGCLPCYRTIFDMENPETVKGWDFDEKHAGFYDIVMYRWPMILGANNLRAAPTGALGLGALALQGIDPRADQWLRSAVNSTDRFLKLFSPDGSYFEGLSYWPDGLSCGENTMAVHAAFLRLKAQNRAIIEDTDATQFLPGVIDIPVERLT